jgi:hypothetical protein
MNEQNVHTDSAFNRKITLFGSFTNDPVGNRSPLVHIVFHGNVGSPLTNHSLPQTINN